MYLVSALCIRGQTINKHQHLTTKYGVRKQKLEIHTMLNDIQAVLEDGYSEEVEEIENSEWFKLMELFTAVFGSGPKTSNRWILEGMTSIDDVIKAENLWRKENPQVAMGLWDY